MRSIAFVAALMAGIILAPAGALTVTLNTETLLELDQYSSNLLTAQVVDKAPGLGGGVRFEIRFPGDSPLDTQLFYTAARDLDLSGFDTLALTFTVVFVDGLHPAASEVGLYASPFVRDAAGLAHFWEMTYLDLTGGPGSITQDIPIAAMAVGHAKPGDSIEEIGFDVRIEADILSPDGLTLGLLVTPAPGATVVPEPGTLMLLAAGGILLRTRRRR